MCNTAIEELKNVSERETLLCFRLFLTLVCSLVYPKEGGYRENKGGQMCCKWCVLVQDIWDWWCSLPITHHIWGGRVFWALPWTHLLCLDPAAGCIACTVIFASRDAWLEEHSPFTVVCHWLDRGSFLSDTSKIYAEMQANTCKYLVLRQVTLGLFHCPLRNQFITLSW